MKTIKKLNLYFFDQEEITLSDAFWFYGVIIMMIIFCTWSLIGRATI